MTQCLNVGCSMNATFTRVQTAVRYGAAWSVNTAGTTLVAGFGVALLFRWQAAGLASSPRTTTTAGAVLALNFGGSQAGTHSFLFGATGGEVSRTFVPEPSTAPLAGLGLLALSGYAARRRTRRHTRRT